MSKLNGKVAVITGGSSGIGLAAAKKFVEEGAHVFITGRRQSELDKAKAAIGTQRLDRSRRRRQSRRSRPALSKRSGPKRAALDIVVASAGFVERVLTQDVTPAHFDKTFAINARGRLLHRAEGTAVDAQGRLDRAGVLRPASEGLPEHGTYAATKAAVRSFARTWAMELKDRGIRVNTLSPGAIDTPIIDGQFKTKEEADGARAFFSTITPLGRIGRPEEMASAILFLASDDSSYSTGIDLVADGGITQV